MRTTAYAATPERLPAWPAAQSVLPSPLIVLGQAVTTWAFWGTVIVSGLIGLENDFGPGRLLSGLVMAFLGFAFVSLGDGLVSLLWKLLGFVLPRLRLTAVATWLRAIPPTMIGRMLGVFCYIAGDLLWPDTFFQHILIPPVGELFIVLLAFTGALSTLGRQENRSLRSRYALAGTALLLNVAFLVWIFQPGTDRYVAPAAASSAASVLDLPDPGLPGSHVVQMLTYGSGSDRNRAAFREEADLRTEPVDGSQIFAGYPGLAGSYFRWYWGFDFTQLPLNGRVWYPQGKGPFPIVLIVHGNHAMTEFSDPGYAYLGQHLASHGYIAVSVDENFLNGTIFIDGHMAEMPLRAWLLLKHLQLWRTWNGAPGNPFYGLVDVEHVALIGHSRGGEAVAAAAAMNWRVSPPASRVSSADEFGFDIEAVVAIAPSDGSYKPDGRSVTLSHSDYLLLGGGHDADTYTFYGQALYNRVRFTNNPDGFKALAYVYQANHGQFNTVWANRDRGWLNSLLLNRRPLLSAADQQKTALVFISAFLEASLRGEERYRALFANPTAGNAWLPDTMVVTQYEPASFVAIDTGPPNSACGRLDDADGSAWTEAMTACEREALFLRDGTTRQQNVSRYLSWPAHSDPVVGMVLGSAVAVGSEHALTFALTSALDEASPIQVTIELETAAGRVARLPLSQFGPVYPPLPARLVKVDWLSSLPAYKITLETPFERVLQTYSLPMTAFQEANPAFLPGEVRAIRFFFDGTQAGATYLDQVGFVPGT